MGTLTAQGDPRPTGVGLGIGPPQFCLRTGTPKLTTVGTPHSSPQAGGMHPSSSSSSSSRQAQEQETAGRDNGINFIGSFFVF